MCSSTSDTETTINGFVYVATGDRFKKEANESAKSLKQHMPDANLTVFTDDPNGLTRELYDQIEIISAPAYSFYDKIYAFLNSPYERSVFIDTDTYVCAPVNELFEILDRFNIAAVRDHWSGDNPDCPLCFDDFNTGLVAFQRSDTVTAVFNDWEKIYREQLETGSDVEHDQPAFCSAVYKNKAVTVYVLPNNYNARLNSPIFFGVGFAPKILHGRSNDFEKLCNEFSASSNFRFFLPNGSLVDCTSISVTDKISGLPLNICLKVGKALTHCLRAIKHKL